MSAEPARPVTQRLRAHVASGGVVLGEGAGVHGALLGVESELAPMSEGATIALATGFALAGKRVVVELIDPAGLARAADALADLGDLAARSGGAFAPAVVIRVPGGTDTRSVRVPVYIAGRESDAAAQLDRALEQGGVCVLVDDRALGSTHARDSAGTAGSGTTADGKTAPLGAPLTLRAGTLLTLLASGADIWAALSAAEAAVADGLDVAVVEVRGPGSLGQAVAGTGRVVAIGDVGLLPALQEAFWSLEAPWAALPRGASADAILHAIHQVAGA